MQKRENFHIDLHVHTAQHSECAESLNPLLVNKYAVKAGIHGAVITEHDTLWNKSDFNELQQRSRNVLLFNGVEVTTQNGCHLVVLGIKENGPLHKGISCNDAIDYARQERAIVILAHPFRNGLPPMKILKSIDAFEVGSTSLYKDESKLCRLLSEALQKPGIASSDAHALSMIGWAYTSFPEMPENVQHLCAMIKEGLGSPVLPHSFFA